MLENITSQKLKSLKIDELKTLCDEIRQKIINTVMNSGGHLSSNLGMVELTVALHYVFDFPKDKVIFDVGHQCYTHKLLSGRYKDFDSLRKKGGLSGFPKREESEYDVYNTGHAGTSISAALGIAKARDILGEDYSVLAIIGDGSFNNGLVYEAFNSLKPLNTNILVILNDNGMSISPTVGSMHEYLEMLSRDSEYKAKKQRHANIFERFGFSYDGVYDGNDLQVMIEKLTEIKEKLKTGSVILHVYTKKGKGYRFCEEDPVSTHGVSSVGKKISSEYSTVFGETLCELAENDEKIVAVTAAMTPSLGLSHFFEKYPARSIDVGICEEHATILAASLATQGLKPYYAVYSTFLQRSFDEIVIDICSQNLPVTLCVDRAGITGADGETHQGVFDLSFLNFVPNLTVAVPKDVDEFKLMLKESANFASPLAIRYPREASCIFTPSVGNTLHGWEKLIDGDGKIAILACGERMISKAYAVCEKLKRDNINVCLINARVVKPLDTEMLNSMKENLIVTLEDNALIGGFGMQIDAYFCENGSKRVKNFAYKDEFIPHGGVEALMENSGVSVNLIYDYIKENALR